MLRILWVAPPCTNAKAVFRDGLHQQATTHQSEIVPESGGFSLAFLGLFGMAMVWRRR